jgi:hypothetical protein
VGRRLHRPCDDATWAERARKARYVTAGGVSLRLTVSLFGRGRRPRIVCTRYPGRPSLGPFSGPSNAPILLCMWMTDFYSIPGEQLLAMEPDELAGVVLSFMNRSPVDQSFHPGNFAGHARNFPNTDQNALQRALMEAWSWLIREGLLAIAPGEATWYFVTRRGQKLKTTTDFQFVQESGSDAEGASSSGTPSKGLSTVSPRRVRYCRFRCFPRGRRVGSIQRGLRCRGHWNKTYALSVHPRFRSPERKIVTGCGTAVGERPIFRCHRPIQESFESSDCRFKRCILRGRNYPHREPPLTNCRISMIASERNPTVVLPVAYR